jgi:hypothetical protein
MTQQLATNTTSISQPVSPIDRRLSDAITVILNTAECVNGQTVVRNLPSPMLKRDIEARQAELRRGLAPLDRSIAEKKRAAKAVAAVLSGWVNAKVADPAAKVSAYIAILGDLPCWVVEQICREVARGHVNGIDPDFPPSAARLHQLGEQVIARLRKEAVDLETVKNAKLSADPTPEERKIVGLKFMELQEEMAARTGLGNRVSDKPFVRDEKAFEAAQARVRREYAALGKEPPSPLALSPTALKAMRDVDAGRAMGQGEQNDNDQS